jgi:hypothetical protein
MKWKRRVAICLAIPVVMAICGLALLAFQLKGVGREIELAEHDLEAQGIRVRPFSASDDAVPHYRKIVEAIKSKESSDSLAQLRRSTADEPILRLFSEVPDLPVARFLRPKNDGRQVAMYDDFDLIAGWLESSAKHFARNHDWARLDQVESAFRKLVLQMLPAGRDCRMGYEFESLFFLMDQDQEVGVWLRKKLEAHDRWPRLRALYSKFLRASLKELDNLKYTPSVAATLGDPWWGRLAVGNELMRKQARLEMLRQFSAAWRQINVMSADKASWTPFEHIVMIQGSGKSVPAKLARVSLNATYHWIENNHAEISRRTALISIDLRDQLLRGKPARLTWSAPLARLPDGSNITNPSLLAPTPPVSR